MTRVLLVDHRPLIRAGLQAVLSVTRDLELLPGLGHQPWPWLCQQHKVDLLLFNAHSPGLGLGIESLLTEMANTASQTSVLMMLEADQVVPFNLHKILQNGGVMLFYQMIH
jgi:DNA-binding NarL/FixJ family response regulator